MRRLFLILLIALLPLRALAGDAMSVAMALDDAPGSTAALHADCPGHAATGGMAVDAGAENAGESMDCESCQLCFPLVQLPVAELVVRSFAAAAPAPGHGRAFHSADAMPALKPPIS